MRRQPGCRSTLPRAFWIAIGLAASVWLVRRLDLPLWWVLFPPLTHAIWNGNPQTLMLALLVAGTAVAGASRGGRQALRGSPPRVPPAASRIALLVLALTLPFLPWEQYLDGGFSVGLRLTTAWNGSAWRFPLLLPPTLLALWVLRRRGGEWFSIPRVFPATQFYYVSTALPALAGRPLSRRSSLPQSLSSCPLSLCSSRSARPLQRLGGRARAARGVTSGLAAAGAVDLVEVDRFVGPATNTRGNQLCRAGHPR